EPRLQQPAAVPDAAAAAAASASAAAAVAANDALVQELQSLKTMITQQFASISWFESVRRSPTQGRLLRALTAAGFSLKLARAVVARLPADFSESQADRWLEETLARNLRCSSDAGAAMISMPSAQGRFASTSASGPSASLTFFSASRELRAVNRMTFMWLLR
ncbi:MAG TPA: hypothetical protein VM491_13195, partial [Burkholderiaceae bacterium]|nr:hypothetical protein [Burkholderiaceae bacterium]